MDRIRSYNDPRSIVLAALVAAVLVVGLMAAGLPTWIATMASVFFGAMAPRIAVWWADDRENPSDPLAG